MASVFCLGLVGAQAADFYWDQNGATAGTGGTGNWSTSNTWRSGSDTGTLGTWANSASNNAVLAGTAGTITIDSGLSSGVSAGTVTINTTGYKITSAANGRPLSATSLVLGSSVAAELNLASAGGTWTLGGITFGSSSALTISGTATSGNANRVNFNVASATIGAGSITLAGTGAGITGLVSTAAGVTLNADISNNASSITMIGATNGNSLTVGGIISGSAGVRFSAGDSGGAGTVTLNAASSYTGDTQFNGAVSSGVVKLGIANGISTASNVIMGFTSANGQNFDLNGFDQTIASLASNTGGTGKITNSGAGTATATLTINGSSTSGSFGLVIEDGATRKIALVRGGSGTTTLSGTNTYTGGTTILGGTLSVSGDAQLGAAPGSAADNVTINGGRLEITGTSQTLSANRNILLGATAGTSISPKSGSGTVTYNGVLKDLSGNTGILVKAGADVLSLGGVSTYSGSTSINNGTVQLTTGNDRLPTGTTVSLGQASSTNLGTLDLNGRNQQIAGLNSTSGTNATTSDNTVTSSSAATLTLGGSGTYSYGDGTNANSGVIIGTISIVKSGSGTQTLGDANTYTGSTILNAGTLQVGAASTGKSGTGATTVNGATAVLAGTGSVEGSSTSVILGIVKPGDSGGASTGTLNTKTLIFTPVSSTTVAELQITSAAAFDVINITGDLTLNSFSNIFVNGSGYTAAVGNSFTLVDWSGVLALNSFSTGTNLRTGSNAAGNEGNLDLPDITGIGFWDISNFSGSGALTLTVVVPEPTRGMLLLLGGILVIFRRRKING